MGAVTLPSLSERGKPGALVAPATLKTDESSDGGPSAAHDACALTRVRVLV